MASFIVKNMQYVIGSGVRSRIPRQPVPGPSNPPGLAPINGAQVLAQNAGAGTVFYSDTPDPTQIVGGVTLYYAFTSLSGGIEGGMVTNDISAHLTETVGPSGADIIQLNVYLPHGGYGPGGGPGAIIDAFDEATGMFVNDMFVDVAPDASGTITHDANYLGAFSSAGATEVVTAYQFITPSHANFDKWLIMPGTGDNSDSVSANRLTVGKNSNVVAFAYYRHQSKNAVLDTKPDIIDHPLKQIGDNIRRPGEYLGDPAIAQQIATIAQKLDSLEGKVNEMGNAFIKPTSRPAVGKTVATKANKRK
ncbi:MAG TPA: hypothetical protein VFK88_10460 [Gallionella sp.]|nr:hypothetical protein [Gallionella sp.]